MTYDELYRLLVETEHAHAKSAHDAKAWAQWYAHYMLPRINEAFKTGKEAWG